METHVGFDHRSIMDPEPGRCRRTDGKKWRCGKDVIPYQKYCEQHMHRGRGRSRKPVEASEISLESVPVNPQLAHPSPKSNSNNSNGKAHATISISSVSGSENTVHAKKESTAAANASPAMNGIDKESSKNVYHSKDTMRPMTTTGLWTAGSDQINKCTSNSNSSIGALATSAISSICGSGNKICAEKDPSAVATATPTTKNVDKEGDKNIYHSKDTTRSTTTGGPWRAGFENINKCTSNSNSSIGKAPATFAISSIRGSGNKICTEKDPSAAATATPTTNNVDKEGDKNIYHGKDTTRSMTTGGPWIAGFEKINKCTSKSECVDGKDAACNHLDNITIEQSKNYRHAGTAGSPVASRLGFSPDSVLQGSSSSCLKYRNDVESELQRCRRTDGKKWRCGTDVVPNQKYCGRHLHRGAKKPMVAEPVKVALAPLPLDICRATPLAIPKQNLNTNLSLSIAASPQQTANEEKRNTSSSDADTISDDNGSVSDLLALSP